VLDERRAGRQRLVLVAKRDGPDSRDPDRVAFAVQAGGAERAERVAEAAALD
jgi:hypothetical protein